MHDMKAPLAEIFQAQRHARHCPHESGIHHHAILQVKDELAEALIHHRAGKILQPAAV